MPAPKGSGSKGLSPRVRGNHGADLESVLGARSIPACAGEPGMVAVGQKQLEVYPRVCGGTRSVAPVDRAACGLSPRVRGEPAPRAAAPSPGWVYPRVCGGTRDPQCGDSQRIGLSPRVRGNRDTRATCGCQPGSIPACAGEPRPTANLWKACWVYPRVCGGTPRNSSRNADTEGLSPRVRGNQTCPTCRCLAKRSIPACAGEPPHCQCHARENPVYPRVCGGTGPRWGRGRCLAGLSPRVRGNLCGSRIRECGARSIPACAGEPMAL